MIITDKKRLSPDISPETPNQDTGTENMIFTTWYKKTIKQSRINP